MRLWLAFKAFFKALSHPKEMQIFLSEKKEEKSVESPLENTHLRLLGMLQSSSRLIDFFKEEISSFSDAQVGAAVRQIHAAASKNLEEVVTIRPLLEENEGAAIMIHKGYNPSEYKVTGNVRGEPPFKGIVRHRGWKAHKISLPKQVGVINREVLAPAEIEVQ